MARICQNNISSIASLLTPLKYDQITERHYRQSTELKMKSLFNNLSEKDRRRYAAVEADKLGHGGIGYIASLFGIDRKTIQRGIIDLEDEEALQQQRERKKGADGKTK